MIQRARFDPVWFAREILQLKPLEGEATLDDPFPRRLDSWEMDDWQIELLEAACDVVRHIYGKPTVVNHKGHNIISARALQGPGKTFGLAVIMHWFGFSFPGVIPCTAPKLEHLKTRLWKEFRKIQHRAVPGYANFMEVTATRITWMKDPDWFATAETASQPEAMQGLRGKYTCVAADEASGIPEPIYPVILGNLAATKIGMLIMIGNPTRNLGTFADTHRRADKQQDVYLMHIGPQNTRRVPSDWIDKMIRMYGRNSPAVLVRCFGEFSESDRDQLISLQWIVNACERASFADGSLPRLRVSVDVADGGEDESVVTVGKRWMSGLDLLRQQAFNFPPSRSPIMVAEAAIQMFDSYEGRKEVDDFVVDSIGVGAGTAGYLIEKGYRVVTYKGGESADDTKQWRNRRVQSYIVTRNEFRDGRVSIADDFIDDDRLRAEFEAQMSSIRTKTSTERVEDLWTKEEMRRKGIKSPDRADSVAMQFATQTPSLVRSAAHSFEVIESPMLEAL